MTVLVCGGRDYADRAEAFTALDDLHHRFTFTQLINGGARGADRIAHEWALAREIPAQMFLAEWDRYGRSAGARRNQRMLDEGKPELVVAFPGGRGTADMVVRAERAAIPVVRAIGGGEA